MCSWCTSSQLLHWSLLMPLWITQLFPCSNCPPRNVVCNSHPDRILDLQSWCSDQVQMWKIRTLFHYRTAEEFATMAFSIGTNSLLPSTFAASIFGLFPRENSKASFRNTWGAFALSARVDNPQITKSAFFIKYILFFMNNRLHHLE